MADNELLEWKDKLKDANNIVSVISRYVQLNKKGKAYWGCCPFHHEKSPSFMVDDIENYYHCYGCSAHGDVIRFVEKIENVSFWDACKILAEQSNIELPTLKQDESMTAKNEQKKLYEKIYHDAAVMYNQILRSNKGKKGIDYLRSRGLDDKTITKFGLGYCPDWTSLVDLLKKKYSLKVLFESGIVSKSERGNFYDPMAERVMFPIINSLGKVIGFSGRSIVSGAHAKYRNTQQTPLFNKSEAIYGINFLRKAISEGKNKFVILVEGQMDVIALHNAGFTTAVATMGTAFTPKHAKDLGRFSDKVVVCFDGDKAGQQAALKSLTVLREQNLDVNVVCLTDNLDPDEYIKKFGKEAFQKELESALSVNDFIFQTIENKFDISKNYEKKKFIIDVLNFVLTLSSNSEKEIYLKLLSQKTSINLETLKEELFKYQNEKQNDYEENAVNNEKNPLDDAILFILSAIIYKKDYSKIIEKQFFVNNRFEKLYEFVLNFKEQFNDLPSIGKIIDNKQFDESKELNEVLNYNFEKINREEQFWTECLNKVKKDYLIKKQVELNNKFACCEASERNAVLLELAKVTKELKNL